MTNNTTSIVAQNEQIKASEAFKEVFSFGAKLVATVAGGAVGITKAAAVTVREAKADDDSYFGMVANQTVKANFNRAQNTTYSLLKDDDNRAPSNPLE